MIELDEWQKDYIKYQGDKVLVAGRQTGKSEAQAYDNGEFIAQNVGVTALIVSKTERQAEELIIKVLNYLQEYYPRRIGKGKYKPLKSVVWIMHGKGEKPSRVMCLPVGLAGEGVRGYTIHKLSIDEAQLPPDEVINAISPMLLTTGGKIGLSGTPQGKRGFFWKAFENKLGTWKVFHINSEQVMSERPISAAWPEWRRREGLAFLAKEKERMSAKHYAQEYLGQFIEDLEQVFSDEAIARRCIGKRRSSVKPDHDTFLGVDVGRVIDPSTFEIVEMIDGDHLIHLDSIVRKDYSIPQTAKEVIDLDAQYGFNLCGIDGGGLGSGVVDILLAPNSPIKRKVKDLNNASRDVEIIGDKKKKKPLLKEDMYRHLQYLMLTDKITLLDDEEVKMSLKSCQIEYIEGKQEVKIFGNDTHIVEGIIRACWCAKKKALNIWAR